MRQLLFSLSLLGVLAMAHPLRAQQAAQPEALTVAEPTTWVWLGTYGMVRLTKNMFWDAQLHYRTVNTASVPFVGRSAQLYNRHAINYKVTDNFRVGAGGVLRINFAEDKSNPNTEYIRLEPRLWHEYVFAMPLSARIVAYHRIRIEHRWSKNNNVDADWLFRNRWRYRFFMMIPLNKGKLQPGAYYFAPDVELIAQSGQDARASFLDDIRLSPHFGYIHSPRLKFSAGMMYTTGQTLNDPFDLVSRWALRLNVYWAVDARKFEEKIPKSNYFD